MGNLDLFAVVLLVFSLFRGQRQYCPGSSRCRQVAVARSAIPFICCWRCKISDFGTGLEASDCDSQICSAIMQWMVQHAFGEMFRPRPYFNRRLRDRTCRHNNIIIRDSP